jgi:hypothetical protein
MLALCYVDDEQLQFLSPDKNPFKSIRSVRGDLNAKKIIDCLLSLVQNYGEQIIILFYFPHLIETVRFSLKKILVLLFVLLDSSSKSSINNSDRIGFT